MSDYDQLEFRHLKYIKAVAEERSFTAASDRVHITQSTISTQIKHLELAPGKRLS
jgi:LysR family cyn operon transcriptional activator